MLPAEPSSGLRLEREGAILTLAFDRPDQRNSFTPDIVRRFRDALQTSAADPRIRVLVLRGTGGQAFSSGYDIGALADLSAEGIVPLTPEDPFEQALEALLDHPLPTVAMIDGYCVGGGCTYATACDLRLAGESARFGMPPARLGVLYSHRDLAPFVESVGVPWTKYLFFSGRSLDAPTAKRIGLVHKVVPDADLERLAYELAREIAENAPLSVQGTKRVLRLMHRSDNPELDAEVDRMVRACQASEDMAEGRRAFLEKRRPEFKGR